MPYTFPEWSNPPTHFNFTRDVVERWARERPDSLALWWIREPGGDEKKFTFSEIATLGKKAAALFHGVGIRSGDRVLVILPRVPEWWISLLGLIRLGAVPIPGTSLLTTKDVRYRVEAAEVTAIITDSEGASRAADVPIRTRILIGEKRAGWVDFDSELRKADAAFEPAPTRADDPSLIYFTSGTTGQPKMVLHTQASYGLGHRVTGELWLDLKPEDVYWNLSDTGWAKAAWSSFYGPWHMGSCVFTVDARGKFDPVTVLRTMAEYPITVWCAAPTALRLMVREDFSKWKFPKLRHCVSAGEPLNPEVIAAWEKATGITIYEGYGQSESVVLVATFRALGHKVRPGSMGHATPGFELAVLDHDLKEVPVGHEGELAVRVSPKRPLGLFREYWKNPEENEGRFRGEWYLTGDVAKRDAEGCFWFVGRADDVIKSSGYRIGPFEVESALIEHASVLEAAVVGKPDELRGALVKAFVVLRKGIEPSDALKVELQEHCKKVTAPYKYPREIEFMKELPKTISGKIRRVELRQRG